MQQDPSVAVASQPASGVPTTRSEKLRRFLQAYWLRPENALWMTLRSEMLSCCAIEHPSIDVGCGDGVFVFLHNGGLFDPDFDVFASVARLDRVRNDHVDMFDHIDEGYQPAILSPATNRIDVGADHKASMLAKARCLDVYDRLVEHDSNNPLPFDDDAFQTVYCNGAYWVAGIEPFLRELARITRPGGRVILQVKLDSIRACTLEAYRDVLGDRFLDIIGRGRLDTWPSLADQGTWESRFHEAGLPVESATPFVTSTHGHIWDIGLRPIAPMLVKMVGELRPDVRSRIKREWVDLFHSLLEPLCDPKVSLIPTKSEPAEVQYVLKPKKR